MAAGLRFRAFGALVMGWAAGCGGAEAPRPARSTPAPAGSPVAAAGQPKADPWLATFRERARRDPNDGALLYNVAALADRAGAADEALGGSDGLALRGRTPVGVQNALGSPRVVRAELDARASAVVSFRVLEASSPALELPTTGAVAGELFYVIANRQLRAMGPDGRPREGVALRDPTVLALPLGG